MMEEGLSLLEKVEQELYILESIYSEDEVVFSPAQESEHGAVECVFKLQPNTGFNMAKVAVVIFAKFTFKQSVMPLLLKSVVPI